MPVFNLVCGSCSKTTRQLASSWGSRTADASKCDCGGELKRAATGPSTRVVETLDNGAMPRSVERLANAEELYRKRAESADPLAGGGTDLPPTKK